MFKKITLLALFIIGFLTVDVSAQTDHGIWSSLLKKHVSPEGKVDYNGFQNDKDKLSQYLSMLAENTPSGTSNDKLAFWINAYNAYTVMLIVDHFPVSSIKEISSKVNSPTPWDHAFANVGGKTFTLNQIEHEIIRVQFDEPLIHFAVNCAARSCPVLRNEAFIGSNLKSQLNEQASIFLSDSSKNRLTSSSAQISQIFNWFKDDFTKKGSLVSFLNEYSDINLDESAEITFVDYKWELNN